MSSDTSRPARRRTPRKRSGRAARPGGALVTRQRKLEVLGLVLLVLAALLTLAAVTHSVRDDGQLASEDDWGVFLEPRDNRFDNGLGFVGAVVSRALVTGLLGYPVVAVLALVGVWGYVFLRRRQVVWLPLISGLVVLGAVLAAALAGWWGAVEGGMESWSGWIGQGLAGWLVGVLKPGGALVMLLLMAAVTALLAVDHDIQTSLDRAEGAAFRLREGFAGAWSGWRGGAAERKVLREQALAERRERRDEARARAEAEREAKRRREEEKARQAEERRAEKERAKAERAPEPARAGSDGAASPFAPLPEPPARPPLPDTSDAEDPLLDDLVSERRPAPRPDGPRPEAPRPADPPVQGPPVHVHTAAEEAPVDLASRPAGDPLRRVSPYVYPPLDLLDEPDPRQGVDLEEIEENKQLLLDKLETYNIEITAIDAVVGPTVTRYELTPAPGVKISRITALEDDLAMALAAPGIRIIAPIPGKSAIGVEIPNRSRELVRLRSMLSTARFRDASPRGGADKKGAMALPVIIGKSIEGDAYLEDLAKMPHLLIAGATGSGKSVGLNTLIAGLLYACRPVDLKFVLVDPKKIELNLYAALLEHFIAMPEDVEEPITTDFAVAAGVLRSCEREMERRYDKLAEAGVRGLKEYNEKVARGGLAEEDGHRHLPYIVVVIDELADLMMTSGKEVEAPIARLAQMARAVGIHLVIATQRPSVDVITGLIKANFPSRIAYQVASRIDSRTILDQGGAHQLVGNGDLLYMNGSRITRLQGPFLSVDEVERVTAHIARQPGFGPYLLPPLEVPEFGGPAPGAGRGDDDGGRDDMFEDAARAIVRSQQGSVSLLQRKLSIGYTRAARIVDQLEDAGIVGPSEGSKAREVLVGSDAQLDEILRALQGSDDL